MGEVTSMRERKTSKSDMPKIKAFVVIIVVALLVSLVVVALIATKDPSVCLSIRNCIKRAPKSTVPGQHRFGF